MEYHVYTWENYWLSANFAWKKTGHNKLIFSKEEEINIGDDVYIKGIYLSKDKEEYAIAYKQGYPDIEIPIRLDILYDGILTGIMYILRKYVK